MGGTSKAGLEKCRECVWGGGWGSYYLKCLTVIRVAKAPYRDMDEASRVSHFICCLHLRMHCVSD